MAARSIWNGLIGFGMVSIPVKLFSATEDKDIHFNQLCKTCNSKIKQVKRCPNCVCDLSSTDLVKGYEYSKDSFVVLSEEDLACVPVPTKKLVQISSFINMDEIDPIHYDKTYYLEPAEAAGKPFALLLETLKNQGKVGLAKFTLRTKERLCLLRAKGRRILLTTLLYPDEIRVTEKDIVEYPPISEDEITMGAMLVNMMSKSFNPSEVKDTYRDALLQVIESKMSGTLIHSENEVKVDKVDNLMDALIATMQAMKAQEITAKE